MKTSDPVEILVEELHPDGYGLSAGGDFAVFGALPGETVIAEPFTRKRKRTFARARSVACPAASRVSPVCSAADRCGGCNFQHLDGGAQIAFKQNQLVGLLEHAGPDEILAPLVGPLTNYRCKARLGVKYVRKMGRVLVGFREKMKPIVADIERCEVLKEPVGALLPELAELIEGLSCFDAIPQIEVARGEDKVALVFRHMVPLTHADQERLCEFARGKGMSVYLQPGDPASAYKLYPADNDDRLHYSLPEFDLELAFHPLDFVQVNLEINRKMVGTALELLALEPSDRVMDAFCGIGNFSLPIAKRAAFVHGYESALASVDRARQNALFNGVENCVFESADLLSAALDLPELAEVNKILIDPPRTGAEQLAKKLASSKVERVVYVSCNPQTLARDASLLVDGGYRFEKAGVIDMFPHTSHVESISVFSRSS